MQLHFAGLSVAAVCTSLMHSCLLQCPNFTPFEVGRGPPFPLEAGSACVANVGIANVVFDLFGYHARGAVPVVHFFGLLAGRSAAALLVVLAGVWGFGFVQGSGSSANASVPSAAVLPLRGPLSAEACSFPV